MRLRAAATLGLLLSAALILSSCGGERTSAAVRPTGEATTAAYPRPQVKQIAATTASDDSCRAQLGSFVGLMASLRRNLARGRSYGEYLHEVQEVRRAYHRIRPNELSAACLLYSGGPAEGALNRYIDAANDWGNCLATSGCGTASVEPKLQRKWVLASKQLSLAQHGLRQAARG
jgi:hypothetical protein